MPTPSPPRPEHDQFRTPEIVLREAEALFNATVTSDDSKECERLAQAIAGLRAEHGQFQTPEIALQVAEALCNATVDNDDPKAREDLKGRALGLLPLIEKSTDPEVLAMAVKVRAFLGSL